MRLPDSWVDELFGRLSVRYGTAFLAQYRDVDIAAVKADWAAVLGWFGDKPRCIAQALEWLPADKAPNAMQFKAMALEAARMIDRHAALPAPPHGRPPPPEVRKLLEGALSLPNNATPNQRLLERLRRIRDSGEPMSVAQRHALAAAEDFERHGAGPAVADGGSFRPIPRELWPASMQADYA